ncbi:beta-lactamase regulating signal transducer with metallopeptidase domain [Aurantimicrobium minutum]|uniref:M56 family metallopeptidase n=1 Tax=Aurantimicrobium minutum TaxID=708131 RepID=UPI0024755FA3|nr:M56 family metallopeptidase [Aurantimicrobium minutum]MDH6531872.1 beta-lactamase regulating signal transducer with metallopeptidase domain [Aurantimicrobium minutum]
MELRTIVVLIALYAVISLTAPRILANPRLVSTRPQLVLMVWFLSRSIAALSLLTALIALIVRALAQYVTDDNSARIIGPILENVFGWIAVAALGIVVFRCGAAVSELRSQNRQLAEQFASVSTLGERTELDGHHVLLFPSSQPLLMAVPSAQIIMMSSDLAQNLSPELRVAALAHEQAHIDQRHDLLRSAGVLAMAIAPGFSASSRMAQATRITTELLADDAAARQTSPAIVAHALVAAFGDSPLIAERVQRLSARSTS